MEAVELLWSPQSALGESQSDRDSVLACERHPEEEDFPAEPRCCLSWQMNNLSDTRRYKSCLDPSHTLVPIIPCAGGRHLQVPQVIPGPSRSPQVPRHCQLQLQARSTWPSWACFVPATLTSVPAHHQQLSETTAFPQIKPTSQERSRDPNYCPFLRPDPSLLLGRPIPSSWEKQTHLLLLLAHPHLPPERSLGSIIF